MSLGELDIVEPMAREALAVAHATRDLRSEHFAHHFLADCPLIRGDCAAALPRYRRALELAVELGDRAETAIEIQGVAMAAAGCGEPARALRLAGAAAAEFEALAIDLSGIVFWSTLLERYLGRARSGGWPGSGCGRVGGRPQHRVRTCNCAQRSPLGARSDPVVELTSRHAVSRQPRPMASQCPLVSERNKASMTRMLAMASSMP